MKIDLSSPIAYNLLCTKRISLTDYVDYIDGKITLSSLIINRALPDIRPSNNILFGITTEGAGITDNGIIMKKIKDLKSNEAVLIKSDSEYERITGFKGDILSPIILKSDGEICNIDSIDPPITLYNSKDIMDCFKPYIVRCTKTGGSFTKKGDLYICVKEKGTCITILVNNKEWGVDRSRFQKI